MHRLYTIRFSHYNEKARWALDRFGVSYVEVGHMPGMHFARMMWLTLRHGGGQGDRVSTRFSTPALMTDDGRWLRDSRDIVRYASERFGSPETTLLPAPEAAELEQHFHDHLGPHTRRVAYWTALGTPALLFAMADRNVGPVQAALFKRLFPLLRRRLVRALSVTRERADQSLARTREEFAAVERRLADGRPFLLGDRFTAADLAFACMASPVLLVGPDEGFGAWLPRPAEFGPETQALIDELRASVAGRFALRLFREERGTRRIPLSGRGGH
jgi:glutathione S-transferase